MTDKPNHWEDCPACAHDKCGMCGREFSEVSAPLVRSLHAEIERLRAHAVTLANTERMVEQERWMEIACDGWRVLQGLDERAQKRTSHQNVSDTLDALVRVIRAGVTQ